MRKLQIVFFLILIGKSLTAQDTCHLRLSLLTCSPGEELYSTFGHSAIRVIDSLRHQDIVYNYGTFDFNDPQFYAKFVRGKLLYYLSTEEFKDFEEDYRQDKRGITEQVFNLNCWERNKMNALLINNLKDSNRFYKYDFFFDNCTTRLRDLLERSADSAVVFKRQTKEAATFRQLIYEYLDMGDKQWSKLGIDLFLGSKTDVIMTTSQTMFLPDYLMKTFDSSKIGNKVVIASKADTLSISNSKSHKNIFADPRFIFSLIVILIAICSFSKRAKVKRAMIKLDSLLFFTVGFFGIIMLLLWFGTNHTLCRSNYNLLWAVPVHAIFAFFSFKKAIWVKYYFSATAATNTLLLLVWGFLPQHLNIALIPVILALLLRSSIRLFGLRQV